MSSKIYVGGLPYATTDAQLQDLFATHGAVESARVITDKFTGRSRGFGFVEMSNSDEAQKAIQALNGTDFEGRNLKPRIFIFGWIGMKIKDRLFAKLCF